MQSNPDQNGALNVFQELVRRDVLSLAFEHCPQQVLILDADSLRFVAANVAARRALGVSLARLRQMTPADLPGLSPGARLRRVLNRLRRRPSARARFDVALVPGSDLFVQVDALFVDGVAPSFAFYIGEPRTRDTMDQQEARGLRVAVEVLPDAFVLYDRDDRLVTCNAKYREFYGESAPAMVKGARFVDILRHGLARDQYKDAIGREEDWLKQRLAAHERADDIVEQQLSDGRWLRVFERKTPDGGRVGLRVDITEVKKQQAALDMLSRTDDLTGLLNRRGLLDRARAAAADLRPGHRMFAMQIDLDRFKIINERQGHDAGDAVLRAVAARISDPLLRPVAVARVGGDEFVILVTTRRQDESVLEMCRRLIDRLTEAVPHKGMSLNIGAGIGVAPYRPERSDPITDMLTGADVALQRVKQAGSGTAMMFRDSMREEAQRVHQMAEQMQLGLTRGEFEPYFQPQIDTSTREIIGFEALIRWIHPKDGMIPAYQFLDVAHRAGLTEALDEVVMDRACFAARQLLDWGCKAPRISINMSLAQVSDPGILSRLLHHMRAHNVTSENIHVELLESTLLDGQSNQIVSNVQNLIAAGFPVELDDFGTGHAAIATLRKFAVSCIKIDRSLVQNIDSDSELQVITAAIINLAKRLGIAVLAEGVETRTEEATLRTMGCHRVQGYLHARPMPLAALRDFLTEWELAG